MGNSHTTLRCVWIFNPQINSQVIVPFNPLWSLFLLFTTVPISWNVIITIRVTFYEELHICTSTLVHVKFLGQNEPQTSSKYLVIADLQTIFHTQFGGLLTTYLHTKFHIPTHN